MLATLLLVAALNAQPALSTVSPPTQEPQAITVDRGEQAEPLRVAPTGCGGNCLHKEPLRVAPSGCGGKCLHKEPLRVAPTGCGGKCANKEPVLVAPSGCGGRCQHEVPAPVADKQSDLLKVAPNCPSGCGPRVA